MKKVLLATTAVAVLAAVSAPASAQSAFELAKPMEVEIGGGVRIEHGYWSFNEDSANEGSQTGREFREDFTLDLDAFAETTNGFEFGIDVDMELASADGDDARDFEIDEAEAIIRGGFGTVSFGIEDDLSGDLLFGAPTDAGHGMLDGDLGDFLAGSPDPSGDINAEIAGEASRVSYVTPRFAGVLAGIEYIPEDDNGDNVVQTDNGLAGPRDAVTGGVNYEGAFSGVEVGASAVFATASFDQTGVFSNSDDRGWKVGAGISAGYSGFTFGAAYVNHGGIGGIDDHFNVGIQYETGPIIAALAYAKTNDVDTDTRDNVVAGITYGVAEGLDIFGQLDYFNGTSGFGGNGLTKGVIGIMGIDVSY